MSCTDTPDFTSIYYCYYHDLFDLDKNVIYGVEKVEHIFITFIVFFFFGGVG